MSDQRSSNSDRRDPLGFDEILALLVAFSAVGAILWWSIGRKSENWLGQRWLGTPTPDQVNPSVDAAPEATTIETAPERVDTSAPTANQATVDQATVDPTLDPSPGAALVPGSSDPRVAVAPAVVAPTVVETAPDVPPASSPTASPAVPVPIVVPSVSPQAVVNFPDVPADYWAALFITALSQRGIVSGFNDGTFQPEQPLTRAQYAALLENVLQDANQVQIAFNDIPAGFWGAQAVDEAVKSGFLKGYPNATFQPDQPISKMQVLLSLVNGFRLPTSANPDATLQLFRDSDQIPDWAKPAIATATTSGIVVNYPNRDQLNPNQPATRAEVAAMLYQSLTATGQLPPVQSNYIVRP